MIFRPLTLLILVTVSAPRALAALLPTPVACESALVRREALDQFKVWLGQIRDDIPVQVLPSARPRAVREFFHPALAFDRPRPVYLRSRIRDEEPELELFLPGGRTVDDQFLALLIGINPVAYRWRPIVNWRDFTPWKKEEYAAGTIGLKSAGQWPGVSRRYVELNTSNGELHVRLGIDVACDKLNQFMLEPIEKTLVLSALNLYCRVPVLEAWYPQGMSP